MYLIMEGNKAWVFQKLWELKSDLVSRFEAEKRKNTKLQEVIRQDKYRITWLEKK